MFVVDASALIAVLVGFAAAVPAYSFTHQTARGRARGAIAYLSGLGIGIAATVALFLVLRKLAFHLTFGEAALAGAFFGPFVGLLSGAWVRTGRKRRRNPGRPDWQRSP
jgi:membrane associated rhomboid family serine protease